MKIPWILFGLCLAMCVVLAILFIQGEVPSKTVTGPEGETTVVARGHGYTHPEYGTLQVGGPGAERHSSILFLGWLFGLLLITFFITCLVFGMRKKGTARPVLMPIIIGGVIFAAIYSAMVWSYSHYMQPDAERSLLISLPTPTALMVYGMWGFPVFFIIFYIWVFDAWHLRPEDEEEFAELVKRQGAATGEEG